MKTLQTEILGLMLLLVGLAFCGLGLWLMLQPAQYEATAKIKTASDNFDDDVGDYLKDHPEIKTWYDPYFITSIMDRLRSDDILTNVVERLRLNEVWYEDRFTGSPLKTTESTAIIRKHLRLAHLSNTMLTAITFYSTNPKEAVQIPNTIAEVYREYRMKQRIEKAKKELKTLQLIYHCLLYTSPSPRD